MGALLTDVLTLRMGLASTQFRFPISENLIVFLEMSSRYSYSETYSSSSL